MKEKVTLENVKRVMKEKGYKFFDGGDYDVNVIGIRNSEINDKVSNKFDDLVTISYREEDRWIFQRFDATTDPGKHWIENLLNPKGTAVLVPGQYRSAYKIGKHHQRYDALRQVKPVKVYRDNNLDETYDYDEDTVDEGIHYINIHRATRHKDKKSSRIDRWSAGCQVIASYNDFAEFMDVCYKARDKWGNSFTYTLLESKDF
jgi:hypothetical protein